MANFNVVCQRPAGWLVNISDFSVVRQRSIPGLTSISDLSVSPLEKHAFLLIILYENPGYMSINILFIFGYGVTVLPYVSIGRTPDMNHLTASGLLRSQFSRIRQIMNGMVELLPFLI